MLNPENDKDNRVVRTADQIARDKKQKEETGVAQAETGNYTIPIIRDGTVIDPDEHFEPVMDQDPAPSVEDLPDEGTGVDLSQTDFRQAFQGLVDKVSGKNAPPLTDEEAGKELKRLIRESELDMKGQKAGTMQVLPHRAQPMPSSDIAEMVDGGKATPHEQISTNTRRV